MSRPADDPAASNGAASSDLNPRILIVGGGASGAILAANLLRHDPRREVVLIERSPAIGAGIAYATDDPAHLLNTRAANMSAFPDDPEHFWRWLAASGHAERLGCADAFCFLPRKVYRAYLGDLLAPHCEPGGDGRLRVITGTCVDLAAGPQGVVATLADGETILAASAVLATGYDGQRAAGGTPYLAQGAIIDELGIAGDHDVLIVGTGLSMVDRVASLRRRGHQGRILALSRRGLLPQVHAPAKTFRLDPADIPFGTGMAFLLRWLRRTIAWAETRGGSWRDIVDALRPHTQMLWRSMTPASRRRFLRHARAFWDVHRHRMAPASFTMLEAARADGQLSILAGRIESTRQDGPKTVVTLRERGEGHRDFAVDRVVDCTGVLREFAYEGLVATMVAAGTARLDPLAIGIDVDEDGALIGADGVASPVIFAVGPPTRARFWEITAVPDIRVQCAALSRTLASRASAG
ncbi:FAD/NAD(P)-binding protein [Aureimonas pseudogalii]|uniref:Putative NAD(P)/FAD-binding protein YdhS n=1 Tax=Aureimonas pseudogalii TaxID=1744844 RepID=A0A7W6H4U6_9HYPH|nr:FAD/NAD(P)-binding protein [Aureimonas pseudogalii]MBB3998344.1 putative NAD(P)/FAD-binding protein YdhS [Aureimonas pseudogalii]